MLLLTLRTRLKKSLPHSSVALPGGLFAQPIEMGVTPGTRPLLPTSTMLMSAISIACTLRYCAIRDPFALQDERTEIADRQDQITKDVSVMRLDHLPAKGSCMECGKAFL